MLEALYPRSTLFVVWNMATSDTERAGMFSPGRDLGSAFRAPGDHVFVVVADEQGKTRARLREVVVDAMSGDDVIITAAVSNEEAQQKFPGFKTIKPYLRVTPQPK